MFQFSHILVPTDFGPAAWQAVKAGIAMAKTLSAELHLVHIYPHHKERLSESEKQNLEKLRVKMERLTRELSDSHNLTITCDLLHGNFLKVLKKYTANHKTDLIMIGTNSSNVDNHMGSHTRMIIENLTCPVMVVPVTVNSETPLVADSNVIV